ncbi:WhiB family transcriptional regulator [Streptomyces sp. NPDC002125]
MSDSSRPTWMAHGACRTEEPSQFFPDGSTGGWVPVIDHAKTICARCPVIATCRTWALNTRQPYGIWGGLTEQERHRVQRRVENNRTMTREQAIEAVLYPRGKGRPVAELFAERSEVDADGHTRWLLQHSSFAYNNRNRTPRQVSWLLTHHREPEGRISVTCGIKGCITGTHLADGAMRRQAAAPAADQAPDQIAA